MSKHGRHKPATAGGLHGAAQRQAEREAVPLPPEPVDVVDGIPDRAARTPAWKYIVIAAIFLAWVAFLVYCWLASNLPRP